MTKKNSKVTDATIKKNRIKWIKALLSGRYKQTRGRVCKQNNDGCYSYCCLGIAGTALRAKKMVKKAHSRLTDICIEDRIYDLSDNLREKLGIDKGLEDRLVLMNDNDGKSFREIGKFLQKTWKIKNSELGIGSNL